MIKKLNLITVIGTLYFLVGIFNILIGISDKGNIAFFIMGLICTVIAIGLVKLWNWIRIIAIIISILFIFIYILLIFGTFTNKFEGWGGLGLLVNFPILLLTIYTLEVLNRPNIKTQFKERKRK